MKKLITLLLVLFLTGCSPDDIKADIPESNPEEQTETPKSEVDLEEESENLPKVDVTTLEYYSYLNDSNPEIIISYKDFGDIKIQLFPDVAPNTVNNFIELVQNGFYSEIIMHRVIEDFMIQGGDPDGVGTGGSENQIPGEFSANGYENTLPHYRGVISMARSTMMDSASSQFFIVHQDSLFLDGNYAGFGAMTAGFEVLDEIASVMTRSTDKPFEDVVIEKITISLNDYVLTETIYTEVVSEDFYTAEHFLNDTNPQVLITFSDDQKITLELFEEVAPLTVAHFLSLIEEETYVDTPALYLGETLIQFGPSFYPTGDEKTVKGEFKLNGVNNELSHTKGVVSLLRGQDFNSGTNHFVIMHQDDLRYDTYLAAFGYIIDGIEVLDLLTSLETFDNGDISEEYTIKSIEVIR